MSRRSFLDFLILASARPTIEGRMARTALDQGRRFTTASIFEWASTERCATDAELESVRALVMEFVVERNYARRAEGRA